MKADIIYKTLIKDFIFNGITDNWGNETAKAKEYITKEYQKTSIGLMFDFAENIEKVYTSVFLSEHAAKKALESENAMILVHHPADWDLQKESIFEMVSQNTIEKLKAKNISVFNMHAPLDNFGRYGTGKTFAEAIGLKIVEPFVLYYGVLAAVICESSYKSIGELKTAMENAVNHRVSLYNYGSSDIEGEKIAVAAGGGNDIAVINEMIKLGIKTLVTGVSVINDFSRERHKIEEQNGINVLGATHYSSEKFAMISMADYFKEKFGLECEFIAEQPKFSDL